MVEIINDNLIEKRFAVLVVSSEVFLAMMQDTALRILKIIKNRIPRDAKIERLLTSGYIARRNQIYLVLQSAYFTPVPPGAAIPQLPAPMFQAGQQPWCAMCDKPFEHNQDIKCISDGLELQLIHKHGRDCTKNPKVKP